MNKPGYERFISLIEGVQKDIRKLKLAIAPSLGIKGVHIFWLEHLRASECGMTAAELAASSMVDRSLISREIEMLRQAGYVEIRGGRRYVLTEEGVRLSLEIDKRASEIQEAVSDGVSKEDLDRFYETLGIIRTNFAAIAESYS